MGHVLQSLSLKMLPWKKETECATLAAIILLVAVSIFAV